MGYQISGACQKCGKCMTVCKRGAITHTWRGYKIDPAKCAGCGACASACPAGAIVADELSGRDSWHHHHHHHHCHWFHRLGRW